MAEIPKLTKRSYDERLFGLNVKPKLRRNDTVTGFDAVDSRKHGPGDEGTVDDSDLTVLVDSTTPVKDDTILQFRCSGGTTGNTYLVACRYSTDMETQLESVVLVEVF